MAAVKNPHTKISTYDCEIILNKTLKRSFKPDFCCRRSSCRRRLPTFFLDRLTSASYKAKVMVFSTSPKISSAAAYSRWWTNDLSWNMVLSMCQGSDIEGKRRPRQQRTERAQNTQTFSSRCFSFSLFIGVWQTGLMVHTATYWTGT